MTLSHAKLSLSGPRVSVAGLSVVTVVVLPSFTVRDRGPASAPTGRTLRTVLIRPPGAATTAAGPGRDLPLVAEAEAVAAADTAAALSSPAVGVRVRCVYTGAAS